MTADGFLKRARGMLRREAAPRAAPYAEVEDAVQRAGALLRGGVPAARVRTLLVDPGRDAPEWRVLAVAWHLAEQSGAPLAPMLERFGGAMRELGRLSERREVLLAAPRSTIRLVALLPPAGLVLSALLGFDPLSAFSGPVGPFSAAAGVLLLILGVRWASSLAKRVSEADWVAGWEFELVAIGIGGGAPPGHAMRRAADCADRERAEWVRLESLARKGSVLRTVAEASEVGAPVGPALLAEAESCRDRARAELERAAERLGVGVLVPLGVCVLPAFVLLGVVPVLIAVVGGSAL